MLKTKVMFFVEVVGCDGKGTLAPLFVLPEERWKCDGYGFFTAISIEGYVPCQREYLLKDCVRPAPVDMHEDMKRKLKLMFGDDDYIVCDAAEWVKTKGTVLKELEN
jgi:hypothetical protein